MGQVQKLSSSYKKMENWVCFSIVGNTQYDTLIFVSNLVPNFFIPVRPSLEPGWLEGNLEGKFGLVPENYVEYIA